MDEHRYVMDPSESPSAAITKLLRAERLVLEVAGRRVWILTLPNRTDDRAIFVGNYWPVVARVLGRYAPAAVTGIDAVRLHLADYSIPAELTVLHRANASVYDMTLHAEFVLRLRPELPEDLAPGLVQELAVPGDEFVPVLAPAALLLTLTEPEIRRGVEAVTAWIRHLVIPQPALDQALAANARPIVLQRLADLAEAAGNPSLTRQLDQSAKRVSHTRASPARTGVGDRIVVPTVVQSLPRGTGTPWTDEQRMRLDRGTAMIAETLAPYLDGVERAPLRRLVAHAQKAKAYDTYHSTTLEGYRINKELSDAIVAGTALSEGPQDEETLRAAMAVQGYSHAFDRALRIARTEGPVDRAIILDLYEALFRPSVDAGRVEAHMLRGWRTSRVTLQGYRYAPPNPNKLIDLIKGLEDYLAASTAPSAVRALVLHLEFVTIHPFLDGNGRIGRLLMNLELLRARLPWITVRADERIAFFKAIERAQMEADSVPFARFLGHLIRVAADEARPRRRRR